MPENFLEINLYLAFFVMRHYGPTEQCLLHIRVFLRGKTKVTETIFPGHTKIVLTSKQTKRLHLQCEKERRPRVE